MQGSPVRSFPKLNLMPAAGKSRPASPRRAFPFRLAIFIFVAVASWCVAIVALGVLMNWIKLPAWV